MAALGVPNPVLWGVVAGLLNFVLYLGPLVMVCLMSIVGIITFDDFWQAMLPPLAFVGLNLIEAYVVTPHVVGRSLRLPPVAVFLSLVFWGLIWGVAGMLIAVPLLVTGKVVAEHAGVGESLESVRRRVIARFALAEEDR
jgi:predicted PurR-regulated permease PerM